VSERGDSLPDGQLPVGHIQMKFVTAPVLIISLAIALGAQVALAGKFAEHSGQALMALPLDPRTAFAGLGAGKSWAFAFGLLVTNGASPLQRAGPRGLLSRSSERE